MWHIHIMEYCPKMQPLQMIVHTIAGMDLRYMLEKYVNLTLYSVNMSIWNSWKWKIMVTADQWLPVAGSLETVDWEKSCKNWVTEHFYVLNLMEVMKLYAIRKIHHCISNISGFCHILTTSQYNENKCVHTHTILTHTHLPSHSILLHSPDFCIFKKKKKSIHPHIWYFNKDVTAVREGFFKINVDVSNGYKFWKKKLDLDPKFIPLTAYLIEKVKTTKYSEEKRKICSGLWRRQKFLKQEGKIIINNNKIWWIRTYYNWGLLLIERKMHPIELERIFEISDKRLVCTIYK